MASGSVLFLAIYYLLKFPNFQFLGNYLSLLSRLSISLFIITLILLAGRIVEKLIIERSETRGNRYNLLRVTRLVTTILVTFVIVSFLFQNLYTLAAGFGLASLVLGFALQAPITSFIGWLYIIFRKPYKVGDRIQVKGMRGDVVEIHYLDTVIRECSGDYIKNDHDSGRDIRFPNSIVLKTEVINYSGSMIPFIWNETAVQVSYSSDITFVEECLMKAATADFKEQYPHRDPENKPEWKPMVYFRNNSYAWMEAVISYPVEPFDTTGKRNRILRKALPSLNEQPDKVQFPEGVMR
ncbi:MAG TPA: mechanosensitive ion channel domain-containing protein [Balneolaceae bacterium]|nr:mechanosensitive ion channel domain-containing protein [Balneolaceae bacterium]